MCVGELLDKQDAQIKYCKDKKLPHFAPISGRCWNCGKQIYERITLEKAGNELVTGCSFCRRSFCD